MGKALDTYKALDDIAGKYSDDVMHYGYNGGQYTPQNEDALDLSDILKRIDAAEKMYAEFRGMEDDIATIANNTRWSVEDIITVKNHVFNDTVLKDDGYGLLDPDYEIAVAWERLIEGNFYESDILLLEHELFEATYYNYFNPINGCTLREAHEFTSHFYDGAKLIKELMKGGGV
ncbi:MAG: hypothetical protein MR434_00400 [Ruminococcus sp.]|nr:hypothetical protein [Ruminococcus sp.]